MDAEKNKTNCLPLMTLIKLINADKPKPLKHGGTEEAEEKPKPLTAEAAESAEKNKTNFLPRIYADNPKTFETRRKSESGDPMIG
jgi:hypothetical protein